MGELDEMLELMRVQRHNFANHLQVISGLLQLKKYDRAFEYIKGVGEELNRAGALARLGIPQLVQAILVAELAAGKKGIHFDYQIHDNMSEYKGDANSLAVVVQEMLDRAVGFLETHIGSESVIKFGVRKMDGRYCIELEVPHGGLVNSSHILSLYQGMKETAEARGWILSTEEKAQYIITLTI